MRLNTEENLQRFLTNSKSSNYQKLITNTTPNYIPNTNSINASSIVYTQSKSNKNISKKDNQNLNKRFTPFFNLNSRQKEKLNISKFFKSKKNYYNNINLITEQNNQKKITKKEELNISIPSKSCKKNNYKTLNYEQTSYGRIMKYFTVKSNNKPMKFDEVSQVFVPIRNTLSNEHRNKNLKKNKKKDENVRDKISYLLNSKDKIVQIFKNNKLQKKIGNKKSSSNNKKEDSNKSQNKIINKEETRIENDINYNNLKTIDNNNEENIHKNSLKNSNQYRIRKINLPSGINLASIQSNNKLLHNLLNKKSKKIHKNSNDRIQTDYNINKNIK
jgi:hypothetical protein